MEILLLSISGFVLHLTAYILESQCEKRIKNPDYKRVCGKYGCTTNEEQEYNYLPIGFKVYHIFIILTGFIPLWGVLVGTYKWFSTIHKICDTFVYGVPEIRIIKGTFADKVVKFFNFDLKK